MFLFPALPAPESGRETQLKANVVRLQVDQTPSRKSVLEYVSGSLEMSAFNDKAAAMLAAPATTWTQKRTSANAKSSAIATSKKAKESQERLTGAHLR